MKKYTLFSFVFILSLILLGFGVKSASASDSGCTSAGPYSTTTGQPCTTTTTVLGCQTGYLFSPVTGQSCSGTSTPTDNSSLVAQFNSLYKNTFVLGSKGDDVKALQQFLKNQGYYFGLIDGKYGRITARAVKDFQDDNDIGTTTTPPITTTSSYKWWFDSTHSTCSYNQFFGAYMYFGLQTFDSQSDCQAHLPVSVNPNPPVISGVSGPQSLNVNQQGTWSVTAYDAKAGSGNLSYSVTWGDEDVYPYAGANSLRSPSSQQSATFTHSYQQARTYTPTFTVTSGNGQTAQTSLSVNVGNTVTTNSIQVLSPNGGEQWTQGTTQTIRWQDGSTLVGCSPDTGCVNSLSAQLYDIQLVPYYLPCTTTACPALGYAYQSPRTIATGVYGTSYNWSIPNCGPGNECSSNFQILAGAYTIQVCQTGTTICGSSNNFSITTSNGGGSTNTFPVINGTPTVPPNITVGQSISFSWHATDANNDDLSWSVDWGEGMGVGGACPANPTAGTGQNWNYNTSHTWTQAGTYTVKVTVSDCRGGSNSNTLTVDVRNATQPLSITTPSNLPNAKVGNDYQTVLAVSGLPAGYTTNQLSWLIVSGSLPDGLYVGASDSGEIIAGTPTSTGSYNFTLSATIPSTYGVHSAGYTTKQFNLNVDPSIVFRSGCSSDQGYSAVDGQSCAFFSGCTSYWGWSSTTGQPCSSN